MMAWSHFAIEIHIHNYSFLKVDGKLLSDTSVFVCLIRTQMWNYAIKIIGKYVAQWKEGLNIQCHCYAFTVWSSASVVIMPHQTAPEFFRLTSLICRLLRIWPLRRDGTVAVSSSFVDHCLFITYSTIVMANMLFCFITPYFSQSTITFKHFSITVSFAIILSILKVFSILNKKNLLASVLKVLHKHYTATIASVPGTKSIGLHLFS